MAILGCFGALTLGLFQPGLLHFPHRFGFFDFEVNFSSQRLQECSYMMTVVNVGALAMQERL